MELYLVRNKEGKYLRAKGYNGYGDSWVEDINKAKIYPRKGTALSQITWWGRKYPEYGVPDLIPLICTAGEPIDQTKRVSDSIRKKAINEAKRKLKWAKYQLDLAAIDLKHKGANYYQSKYDTANATYNNAVKVLENLDVKHKNI
jgi:hypothetical protein